MHKHVSYHMHTGSLLPAEFCLPAHAGRIIFTEEQVTALFLGRGLVGRPAVTAIDAALIAIDRTRRLVPRAR